MCDDSDNPNFFMEYFNYFDSIESHERPDYDFLEQLFVNELTPEELENENLGCFQANNANVSVNINSDGDGKNTNLAVVTEPKWIIPEKYMHGVVIDNRYVVGEHLSNGHTGFVRRGNKFYYRTHQLPLNYKWKAMICQL